MAAAPCVITTYRVHCIEEVEDLLVVIEWVVELRSQTAALEGGNVVDARRVVFVFIAPEVDVALTIPDVRVPAAHSPGGGTVTYSGVHR